MKPGDVLIDEDDHKAKINLRKNGVDFEEGVTVFNDPLLSMGHL